MWVLILKSRDKEIRCSVHGWKKSYPLIALIKLDFPVPEFPRTARFISAPFHRSSFSFIMRFIPIIPLPTTTCLISSTLGKNFVTFLFCSSTSIQIRKIINDLWKSTKENTNVAQVWNLRWFTLRRFDFLGLDYRFILKITLSIDSQDYKELFKPVKMLAVSYQL